MKRFPVPVPASGHNGGPLALLRPVTDSVPLAIPFFSDACAAGFPSPAADYVEDALDLNELCILRPAATFFVRASGSSMQDFGLCDGDVMVVDRAETVQEGDIVIAEVDGEFTVKRLRLTPRPALVPMNPACPVISPDELRLMGVVTWFFHGTRSRGR